MDKIKTVSVIQSNYIPWLGYFAMAAASDVFVVYEDVQYTKNDWRNRNQIECNNAKIWLTVPVHHEKLGQNFLDIKLASTGWAGKHLRTLRQAFSKNPGWHALGHQVEELYTLAGSFRYLFEVNRLFLAWAFTALQIESTIVFLDKFPEKGDPTERLISILQSQGATRYISGPSALSYIDDEQFKKANIMLEYVNYDSLIPGALSIPAGFTTSSVMQHLLTEGVASVKSN
jgi:hypothetical protein